MAGVCRQPSNRSIWQPPVSGRSLNSLSLRRRESATAKIIADRGNRRSALSQPARGNQLPAYPAAIASAAGQSEGRQS